MTAQEYANIVIEEHRPFDYSWIRYVRRKSGYNGLLNIARHSIEGIIDTDTISKVMYGRIARIVADTMDSETW